MKKKKLACFDKRKCTGCAALVANAVEGENISESFNCSLSYKLDFKLVGTMAVSPRPLEKCYKPLNEDELARTKVLLAKNGEATND